jgi:hypothetical protein
VSEVSARTSAVTRALRAAAWALCLCLLCASATRAATWTGGGGDNNWSNGANWDTGTPPGPGDNAIFDGRKYDVDCIIDVDISVAKVIVKANYTSTITQASGTDIAVGGGGWNQSGGTFVGGDGDIDVDGTFTIKDATFTSTSGTLSLADKFNERNSTFNHGNGTVLFDGTGGEQHLSHTSTVTFFNFEVNNPDGVTPHADLDIDGALTIADGDLDLSARNANLNTAGDVTIAAPGPSTAPGPPRSPPAAPTSAR